MKWTVPKKNKMKKKKKKEESENNITPHSSTLSVFLIIGLLTVFHKLFFCW